MGGGRLPYQNNIVKCKGHVTICSLNREGYLRPACISKKPNLVVTETVASCIIKWALNFETNHDTKLPMHLMLSDPIYPEAKR